MSVSSVVDQPQPKNPFQGHRAYSANAVELMRALSADRKENRRSASTPEQVLQVVRSLGYERPRHSTNRGTESRRFVQAMILFQRRYQIPYPTCDHLLTVLNQLGYDRSDDEAATVVDGLPIDRRRNEDDDRFQPVERRSCLDPGPQERMDLTDDEHRFLDALKNLRQNTGRQFASSEELLSILWNLGYRPTSEQGLPVAWLNDEERCRTQMEFTRAVERRLVATDGDVGEFLTCRSIIAIAAELDFQKDN